MTHVFSRSNGDIIDVTNIEHVTLESSNILHCGSCVHVLLIQMPIPFFKWDFMIAIVLLSACVCVHIHCLICSAMCFLHVNVEEMCVHVFVPPCISVDHWKQAHHCQVRGHYSGESTKKKRKGECGYNPISVSDGLDNGR